MLTEGLNNLVAMSHKYGADPAFVLAGGGNTSFKTDDELYVKGSGSSLATIKAEQFVKMNRAALSAMLEKKYSDDEATREAEVLEDMMDARCKGEYAKRPSVETPLHNLFTQKYVLHVHPAMVNGITCSKQGKAIVKELFPEAVWVPSSRPGYILAAYCKKAIDKYKKANGKCPDVLFLENHGIFYAADTLEGIDAIVSDVMAKIEAKIVRKPDFSEVEFDKKLAAQIAPAIRMLYSDEMTTVTFTANKEILNFAKDTKSFAPLAKSYSPDHIVYCKAYPLFVKQGKTVEDTYKAIEKGIADSKAK